ncbi:hypothetical protein J4210_02645 [Candidatus Woesearchaeota archaeon]|nr:hypothetical protein [Candidatus Woesearchaeota archaeon]
MWFPEDLNCGGLLTKKMITRLKTAKQPELNEAVDAISFAKSCFKPLSAAVLAHIEE